MKEKQILVCEKLERIAADISNASKCLEILENSLYFASERADKDMTKPCAAGAAMIGIITNNCFNELSDLAFELMQETEMEA